LNCYTNSAIGNCNYDNVVTENGVGMNAQTPGSGGYDIIGYDSTLVLDRVCMPSTSTFSYLTKSGV
jgi:hypothetical protein